MNKRTSEKFWFPFWVDKWIFGSMRVECNLEERAIWIDLLSIAAKDDGYIRANEDIAYPIQQLAGMLRIPEKILRKSINKFIRIKKLTKFPNKTLFVTEWKKYQFTNRHKRRVMSVESDTIASKTDTIINNNKEHNNKLNNKGRNGQKIDPLLKEKIQLEKEFEEFWEFYRKEVGEKDDDSGDKREALKAYTVLRKREDKETIIRAIHGYADHFKVEFPGKRKMFASTFLRSKKWERFVKYEHKAPM